MVGAMDAPRRRLGPGLVWLRRRLARRRRQREHPMPPPRAAGEADSPLAPVYPFNEPGLAIVLVALVQACRKDRSCCRPVAACRAASRITSRLGARGSGSIA